MSIQPLQRLQAIKAAETAASYKTYEQLAGGLAAKIDRAVDAGKVTPEKGEAKKKVLAKRVGVYKDYLKRLKTAGVGFTERVFTADKGDTFNFQTEASQKDLTGLFPEVKFKVNPNTKRLEARTKLKGVDVTVSIGVNGMTKKYFLSGVFYVVTYDADPTYEAEKRLRRITG